MRTKMKEVVLRWRDRQAANPMLEFNYTKKGGNKSFEAKIATDDTGSPVVELVSLMGYNEKYVKNQLSHYFNLFNTALQVAVGSGDEILTRYADINPPDINSSIYLPAETYYYAVNGGLVYCNGEQIGRRVRATYLGYQMDRCSLDAEPVRYTKYKLL